MHICCFRMIHRHFGPCLGAMAASICRVLVPSDVGGGFISLKCDATTDAMTLKRLVIEKVTAKRCSLSFLKYDVPSQQTWREMSNLGLVHSFGRHTQPTGTKALN